MTKAGKRLLAAVEELVEAVKCDHDWQETKPLGHDWRSTHCPKCGLTKHSPVATEADEKKE